MLERLCGLVLHSVEGLAEEGLRLRTYRNSETIRVYVPVILTTAKLEVCRFDPSDVDLQSGKLPDAQFQTVPFIRFRKGLATRMSSERQIIDFGKANQEKERTVFVVQAEELAGFLKEWQLLRSDYTWPWVTHTQEERAS